MSSTDCWMWLFCARQQLKACTACPVQHRAMIISSVPCRNGFTAMHERSSMLFAIASVVLALQSKLQCDRYSMFVEASM
jgi:hypothetical protein